MKSEKQVRRSLSERTATSAQFNLFRHDGKLERHVCRQPKVDRRRGRFCRWNRINNCFGTSQQVALSSRCSVLRPLVWLNFVLVAGLLKCQTGNGLPTPNLELGLSISDQQSSDSARGSSGGTMDALLNILNQDCAHEFSETSNNLNAVKTLLESYASSTNLEPKEATLGNLVSRKLESESLTLAPNSFHAKVARELDFIYATFYSQFMPTVMKIVMEKAQIRGVPLALSDVDLSYRCKQYQALELLHGLAGSSSIYRILLDTFSSELYVHCLKRKLAAIRLAQIKPTPLVRELVDIYTDFPLQYSHLLLLQQDGRSSHATTVEEEQLNQITRYKASLGLQFDLASSLAKHGSVAQAARLILDTSSAMAVADTDVVRVLEKFGRDCLELVGSLAQVWDDFDSFALQLSSPMSNLGEFSRRIKMSASPLMYGFICTQLLGTF